MNINSEFLFNILFPLTFAFSTLTVYIISNKYIGPFYAFFTAFFFASIPEFSMTSILARSNMAILFFGMLIMVIFHDGIPKTAKKILFIVFSMSIVVSHYSTTYVLFFIFVTTLIGLQIIKVITTTTKTTGFVCESEYINVPSVFIFFTLLFVWYSQVTDVAFVYGVKFVEKSIISLHDLFVLDARSNQVMAMLGQVDSLRSLFVVKIIFITYWATIALIAIGIFDALLKFSSKVSGFPRYCTSDDSSKKIDCEFFSISLVFCFAMAISLIIPNISVGYGIGRQYILANIVLSTFLILGSILIGKYIKIKAYWILTVVLILYFLSSSGALYQITGTPSALILNSEGRHYDMYYINDEDSYAAKWLGRHRREEITVHGDRVAAIWLSSQGGIPISSGAVDAFSLVQRNQRLEGYMYLRSHNILRGKLMNAVFDDECIKDYDNVFYKKSKCYSNSGAEVWI